MKTEAIILEVEKKIGYDFRQKELLTAALTHKSYANENPSGKVGNYERLEFLGDSLLGFAAAGCLYSHKPTLKEGDMSKHKAALVCEASLHRAALRLGIGAYIFMSKGARLGGGDSKPSILADVMEAITAAIYLDGGLEPALEFLRSNLFAHFDISAIVKEDSKSELQEYLASLNKVPEYRLISESGPDHEKSFEYAVYIGDEMYGTGVAGSKKQAQMNAAKQAINRLSEEGSQDVS